VRCLFYVCVVLILCIVPLVIWNCWLGVRKSIRSVKIEWWGVGLVIYLEQGTDCLHNAPADATAIPKPHLLLPHLNLDCFYLSGNGLPGCPGSGCSCVDIMYKSAAASIFPQIYAIYSDVNTTRPRPTSPKRPILCRAGRKTLLSSVPRPTFRTQDQSRLDTLTTPFIFFTGAHL